MQLIRHLVMYLWYGRSHRFMNILEILANEKDDLFKTAMVRAWHDQL